MTACRGLQVLITRLNRETETRGFMLHQEGYMLSSVIFAALQHHGRVTNLMTLGR